MNAWNAMSNTTFFALGAIAVAAVSFLVGCLIVIFRHDDYDLDQEEPDEPEEGWAGRDDETRMLDMWPDVPPLADPDIAGTLQPLPADPGLPSPLLPARGSARSAPDVRDRETGEWEPSPADDIARWAAHDREPAAAAADEHLAGLDELDAAFLRYDMSGAYRAYQELARDAWRAEMGLQPAREAIFA